MLRVYTVQYPSQFTFQLCSQNWANLDLNQSQAFLSNPQASVALFKHCILKSLHNSCNCWRFSEWIKNNVKSLSNHCFTTHDRISCDPEKNFLKVIFFSSKNRDNLAQSQRLFLLERWMPCGTPAACKKKWDWETTRHLVVHRNQCLAWTTFVPRSLQLHAGPCCPAVKTLFLAGTASTMWLDKIYV